MTKPTRSNRSDGDQTRARILEAAGALFAGHGFAETTNKAIAERAGVDLALINYHFGNRSGLYQATLAEAHRQLIKKDDLARLVNSDRPAREKLGAFIDGLVRAVGNHEQWTARILAREVLSPSSHIQVLIDEEMRPKVALIKRLIHEVTGLPEDDPKLMIGALNTMAPFLVMLVAGRTILPAISPVFRDQTPAQLAEPLKTFVLAGLDSVAAQYVSDQGDGAV